jgi:hypothetical protein
MRDWQVIETAPKDCQAILTIHESDLYPVVAFCALDADGAECWMRETEGPEDDFDALAGVKFSALYRRPTHWMPLPDPPNQSQAITEARHQGKDLNR